MLRPLLLAMLCALPGAALVEGAEVAPTPQGMTMSHEKTVTVPLPREKPAVATARKQEQDKIWSGLVYATNAPDPKDPPPQIREFASKLKRIFGYNQFELTGSAAKPIDDDNESWLVPSKSFWLGVRARRAVSKEARGGYLLNLQLYHDQRPIVDTEAKLAPGSPLFIRGPACGKGHLIIVLQIQQ